MTTSTHLRQLAARTGLDSIAEALREGANTIEQHEATIARRDAVIKLLEGEVSQGHEARRAAQAENADLKERQARSGIEMRSAISKAVAAEREACAKVCDELVPPRELFDVQRAAAQKARECADAIRARKD